MWYFHSSNGMMYHDDVYIWTGYSGFGVGKNNPSLENVHGVGPTPRGVYSIGAWQEHHDKLGPGVMELIPRAETNTFGRSEFFIHGDKKTHPGSGSHGCIVKSPIADRKLIDDSNDRTLTVV